LDSSPFVKPGRNCSWPNIYIYSGPTFPYPPSPTKPPAHLFIFHIFMIFIFGAGILFAPAAQIFALRILLRVGTCLKTYSYKYFKFKQFKVTIPNFPINIKDFCYNYKHIYILFKVLSSNGKL